MTEAASRAVMLDYGASIIYAIDMIEAAGRAIAVADQGERLERIRGALSWAATSGFDAEAASPTRFTPSAYASASSRTRASRLPKLRTAAIRDSWAPRGFALPFSQL